MYVIKKKKLRYFVKARVNLLTTLLLIPILISASCITIYTNTTNTCIVHHSYWSWYLEAYILQKKTSHIAYVMVQCIMHSGMIFHIFASYPIPCTHPSCPSSNPSYLRHPCVAVCAYVNLHHYFAACMRITTYP